MRNILLTVVLAGIASLVLVQAQAQSRNPRAACLANCPSCPPRADGSFDPACAREQQNCKVECERQGQYSPPASDILLAQGKNELNGRSLRK
jgi:hypothetical protein